METIYAKNDYIEKQQAALIRQMDYVHSQCVELPISCNCNDNKWGVWLKVDNENILLDPLDLVNSLFVNDTYYMFVSYNNAKYESCCVNVYKDLFSINWSIDHPDFPIKGRLLFSFEEYITKIKLAISLLYNAMKDGKEVYYKPYELELETLDIAVNQLKINASLPNVCRLRVYDVIEEQFCFTPINSEKYQIGIGNRCFTTFLTHWCCNMELIRHQLESIVFWEDAKIKLTFDDSDTILYIEHKRILDEVNKENVGYRFTYKEYAKVMVQPNCFVHIPTIVGYCNFKDVIHTFYEGLLKIALLHDEKEYFDRTPGRVEAYNMYKSPLIERFLHDSNVEYCKAKTRQIKVKEIITICPHYDCFLFDENQCSLDMSDLYDKDGKPIVMPEFDEWQSKIKGLISEAAVGRHMDFGWDRWHKRGIELARQLRNRLSLDFDLWYDSPFEDKSGTIKKSFLVM